MAGKKKDFEILFAQYKDFVYKICYQYSRSKNLWMADKDPPNHSPPQHILDLINPNVDILYKQNTVVGMSTGNTFLNPTYTYHNDYKNSCDYITQVSFEDEFSQPGCMDEQ